MKKTNLFLQLGTIATLLLGIVVYSSCTKEGPIGKDGIAGTNGTNGKDANETCKLCHNPNVVDAKVVEFGLSKHEYGEAAAYTAGNASCAPCHSSEGFKYVCKNNVPATFTLNTTTNKYANDYAASSSTSYGEISCFTCHSSLHTTYGYTDFSPFTTTAAVPMTMWGGKKTIDLTQDGGKGNLCVKCHQPRPMTTTDGNVFDYATLLSAPTTLFYDSSSTTNKVSMSMRTGNHYGSVGAIFAGKGGIEFGTGYGNSTHTTLASCSDCHQAAMTGKAGGHTFFAKGNFNGCNVSGCHSSSPISATSTKFTKPRADIKKLLDDLATKINTLGVNGKPILKTDATEENLWLGKTTKNYDGYLDIYSSSSNPTGYYGAPGNPKFPSLTNAQMGTILNFQLCLREYSLGIHNTTYTTTLLTNSLTAW